MRGKFPVGVAALAILMMSLGIAWWVLTRPPQPTPNVISPAAPAIARDGSDVLPAAPPPSSSPPPAASVDDSQTAFLSAFETPIAFYGRVLDQHDSSVANADVTYYVIDNPHKSSASHSVKTDGE